MCLVLNRDTATATQLTEGDAPAVDRKKVIIFTEAWAVFEAILRPRIGRLPLCVTNYTETVLDHIREGVVNLVVIDITSIASDEIRRVEDLVWEEALRIGLIIIDHRNESQIQELIANLKGE